MSEFTCRHCDRFLTNYEVLELRCCARCGSHLIEMDRRTESELAREERYEAEIFAGLREDTDVE